LDFLADIGCGAKFVWAPPMVPALWQLGEVVAPVFLGEVAIAVLGQEQAAAVVVVVVVAYWPLGQAWPLDLGALVLLVAGLGEGLLPPVGFFVPTWVEPVVAWAVEGPE
jgi:hypothetical protein